MEVGGGLHCPLATLALLPDTATVLHIGLFREKVSLQPVEYYSKVRSELPMQSPLCRC